MFHHVPDEVIREKDDTVPNHRGQEVDRGGGTIVQDQGAVKGNF